MWIDLTPGRGAVFSAWVRYSFTSPSANRASTWGTARCAACSVPALRRLSKKPRIRSTGPPAAAGGTKGKQKLKTRINPRIIDNTEAITRRRGRHSPAPRVIIEYQRARRLRLIPFLRAEVYLLQFRQRRFPARNRGALPRGAGARDPRPRLGLDSRYGVPGRRHAEPSAARGLARPARRHPRTSLGGGHHRSRSWQHHARH